MFITVVSQHGMNNEDIDRNVFIRIVCRQDKWGILIRILWHRLPRKQLLFYIPISQIMITLRVQGNTIFIVFLCKSLQMVAYRVQNAAKYLHSCTCKLLLFLYRYPPYPNHNPNVGDSNPSTTTNKTGTYLYRIMSFFVFVMDKLWIQICCRFDFRPLGSSLSRLQKKQ